MSNVFKTTVLGVGPWCVEFDDGEIVHCRTEERANLIAAAPKMYQWLDKIVEEDGAVLHRELIEIQALLREIAD
jgi:hypothetical protein